MKKWDQFSIMQKMSELIDKGSTASSTDMQAYEQHWMKRAKYKETSYVEYLKSEQKFGNGDYYSAIQDAIRGMREAGDDMRDYSRAECQLHFLANKVLDMAKTDYTNAQIGFCYEVLKKHGCIPFPLYKYVAAHFIEKGCIEEAKEILTLLHQVSPNDSGVKELWEEVNGNQKQGRVYEIRRNTKKNRAA